MARPAVSVSLSPDIARQLPAEPVLNGAPGLVQSSPREMGQGVKEQMPPGHFGFSISGGSNSFSIPAVPCPSLAHLYPSQKPLSPHSSCESRLGVTWTFRPHPHHRLISSSSAEKSHPGKSFSLSAALLFLLEAAVESVANFTFIVSSFPQ